MSCRCIGKLMLWVSTSAWLWIWEKYFISPDNPKSCQCCLCLLYSGQDLWSGSFISHSCPHILEALTTSSLLPFTSMSLLMISNSILFPIKLVFFSIDLHAIYSGCSAKVLHWTGKLFLFASQVKNVISKLEVGNHPTSNTDCASVIFQHIHH